MHILGGHLIIMNIPSAFIALHTSLHQMSFPHHALSFMQAWQSFTPCKALEAHAKILDPSLAFTLRCEHLILAQLQSLCFTLHLRLPPLLKSSRHKHLFHPMPHDLHVFMITFTSCFTMGKACKWKRFPKCMVGLKASSEAPYFGNGFEEHLGKLWESLGTW
jgi:hypothetical protein